MSEQTEDSAARLRDLAKAAFDIWIEAHRIVGSQRLPGGDAIFFEFPVKAPAIEMCDSLRDIADRIEQTGRSLE